MIKSLTTLIPGSVWDIRIRFSLAKVPLVAILVTFLAFSCSPSSKKEIGNENNSPADSASPEFRINSLTSQISSDPTNYILRKERSLLFYKTGNTQKAIEDIDSALVSNKTGPELWHLRGYYQYHLKNDDQSLLDFKESARLGSENPETYFQIGQIYFLKGIMRLSTRK